MPVPSQPILLGVTGNPVLHSKSPQIINAALAHAGLAGHYLRLAADSAAEALQLMTLLGLRGLNVTAPFKQDMLPLLTQVDPTARLIGGANTIVAGPHGLAGWNTDDAGVVQSFRDHGFELAGRRVLVIGAGGAARGAVYALGQAGAQVAVVNRTFAKAQELAATFGCQAVPLADLEAAVAAADAIVSTLAPNVHLLDARWLIPPKIVFDANYKGSPLTDLARAAGCPVITGLDWLINQAIPAFAHFTGATCPRAVLEAALATAKPAPPERLALIGFMGTGKSRNGRRLAQRLGWTFADTDQLIQEKAGKTIPTIFADHGEDYFRQLETAVLAELANRSALVVACGGGMVTRAANRQLLRQAFLPVWLVASLDTILRRTANSDRPLLATDNPRQRAQTLFEQRKMWYAETAELVVGSEPNLNREADAKIDAEIHSTFNH